MNITPSSPNKRKREQHIPTKTNRPFEFGLMLNHYETDRLRMQNTGHAGQVYLEKQRHHLIDFSNKYHCISANDAQLILQESNVRTAVEYAIKLSGAEDRQVNFEREHIKRCLVWYNATTKPSNYSWLLHQDFFAMTLIQDLVESKSWSSLGALFRVSDGFRQFFYTRTKYPTHYLVMTRMLVVSDYNHIYQIGKAVETLAYVLDFNEFWTSVLLNRTFTNMHRIEKFRRFPEMNFINTAVKYQQYTIESLSHIDARVVACLVGNLRMVVHLFEFALATTPINEQVKKQLVVAAVLSENYDIFKFIVKQLNLEVVDFSATTYFIAIAIYLQIKPEMLMHICMRYTAQTVQRAVTSVFTWQDLNPEVYLYILKNFELPEALIYELLYISTHAQCPDEVMMTIFERHRDHVYNITRGKPFNFISSWDVFIKTLEAHKGELFSKLYYAL